VKPENTPFPAHMISLIIPVRFSNMLFEGAERLERLIQTVPSEYYEVVVVDYGSAKNEAQTIVEITENFSHARVVRSDTERLPFSAGNARNIGAQHATHDVIMFNDVDCLCGTDMYKKIALETFARNVRENIYDFFTVPVAFLTFEGTEEFNRIHRDCVYSDHFFHQYITSSNKQIVIQVAYSGSTVVVNRKHYLALGGSSQDFHGHGAEDFEIKSRLVGYNPIAPKPLDYYHNTKNNQIKEYVGFRAYFALYGIDTLYKGIYMVHLWHPRREVATIGVDSSSQYKQTERNFALLRQLMQSFDKNRSQPAPISDWTSQTKNLILCRPNSIALNSIRHVLPYLGQFEITDEVNFQSSTDLLSTIKRDGYERVLLLNPYGNEHRLALYRALREHDIPYLTYDRGALPNSWFFDPNGFNADSSSYALEKWDKDISQEGHDLVHAYTQQIRSTAETLEENGTPKSQDHWRAVFNVGHRKVVFVPLQRPSDTVTRFFGGNVGQYENFYLWVSSIAAALDPAEWVVIAKKHPLEKTVPVIPGVVFAPNDAHVHDLIDLAHVTLLLNSGVGVLSLMFGTPVIACGRAFYAQPGLAEGVTSVAEAVEAIKNITIPDMQKVDRFLHYLLNDFYSFGKTTYVERKQHDGSTVTAAQETIWHSLRQITDRTVFFGRPRKPVGFESIIFNSYGGIETMARARNSSLISKPAAKPAAKPTTSVAKPTTSVAKPPTPKAPTPKSSTPAPVASQATEDKLMADARDAARAGNYQLTASCLEQAARISKTPTQRYRAAAEALVEAGDIAGAIALLTKTALQATDSAPIERRIKELSRSPFLRKLLPEKKYMGLAKLMK